MSSKPTVAKKGPYVVDVEEGKSYFWCACGMSKNQPFCDGSHKDTDMVPVKWTAERSGKKGFCGCKATKGQPMCDGSHNNL
ncbi:Glutamate synthase [NADPH] large chain [hydrothermal vent metagenome]|uniref:Glutamate synthase [NADPH] large chain n=1 Tax=hydrothermal vent metagenome TaxID=652676 RepID=A0A3B0R875_9ZZZZ